MSELLSKNSRQLIFMRHGQTTSNFAEIASGGDVDPDLTDLGRAQAHQAAQTMKRMKIEPDLIITPSLLRNKKTANIINEYFGLDCMIVSSLRERLLGDWNEISSSIINPKLKAGETPPNGESRAEFEARILGSMTKISAHFLGLTLLIGSRGVARIFLESVNAKDAMNFPNGRLLKISLADSEKFKIVRIDEI